ncbi:MAG: NAD-dependent epimerase/dehydratase family protein [Elusimicrobia bacterium]|nr:NAD-dependent epimerase/dehydratase family protein [Elusimicrobiota bacterium]
MKILVLGGTSFFGIETANLLARGANAVEVFSRRCPADGLALDIRQHRGDRTVEMDLVRMSTRTWDVILDNLCFNAEDARKAVKVFSGRTGLYIFTSSASVYSVLEGSSSPFRENQTEILKPKEGLKNTPYYAYAGGKYQAERVFLEAFAATSFPAVIIRPPVVIGPGDPSLRAYSYWLRLADGGPLFLPNSTVCARYAFSKDLARAFASLVYAEDVRGQAFNFGDSDVISLDDFVKLSARIMHKEPETIYPERAWLKENEFNFEASPFSFASDFITDISKAEKAFDWRSTPLHLWLEETINWFFFKYTGPMPKNYARRKSELELAETWRQQVR